MTMAEKAENRREEWERKLRRIDAQTENLHAMNERTMRESRWFPFVVTLGIFAFAYVLAKYF